MAYLSDNHPCCGVEIIDNIGHDEKDELVEFFQEELLDYIKGGRRALFEITLTDDQMKNNKPLLKLMKKHGFKRVARFLNSNSNNNVNMFHKHSRPIGRAPHY